MMFGWKLCSKFNFIAIFPTLANFPAFLDYTKENADVSKGDSQFKVNFQIFRVHMPEAISASISVTLPRVRVAFLPPPNQNRTYQIAQPLHD